MLTWARFKNVSIHAVGDDSGNVELVATKLTLPEGIVRTKRGWHFLPRAASKENKTKDDKDFERVFVKKYQLKGLGKTFFLDYAGQATSMNFGALALLQHKNATRSILNGYIDELSSELDNIPKPWQKIIKKKLEPFKEVIHAVPITSLNLDKIGENIAEMYPPSVVDAFAIACEEEGAKRRGRELMPLILGGAIIIGLVVLGLALIFVLGG